MVDGSLETGGSYVLSKNLKKVKDPAARFNSIKVKDSTVLLIKSKNLLLKHSPYEDQHVARRRSSTTSLRRFMKLQQLKGEVMSTDEHPGGLLVRITL